MTNNDFQLTEATRAIREDVGGIVDDSAEMDLIREAIDEKGLDPIWVRLISQFGVSMYARGRDASTPPISRVGTRFNNRHPSFGAR